MSACPVCGTATCRPVYYHLCSSCMGEGCPGCAGNLVPGIVPGQVEEGGNIVVCTEWADPVVDATMDDQMASLIAAVKSARNNVIADHEEANEAP